MPDAPLPSGGTVRAITRWGHPVMHRRLRPVTEFGADLEQLVADMAATMYAADGVGLAACQIGADLAVFVFDCPDENEESRRGVVCNPRLTLPPRRAQRLDRTDEGCLSLPGAFVSCARPDEATVTGQDLRGEPLQVLGTGLLARCLQHESDHCDGVVFADHLGARAKRRLFREAADHEPEFPAGWPADGGVPQPLRETT